MIKPSMKTHKRNADNFYNTFLKNIFSNSLNNFFVESLAHRQHRPSRRFVSSSNLGGCRQDRLPFSNHFKLITATQCTVLKAASYSVNQASQNLLKPEAHKEKVQISYTLKNIDTHETFMQGARIIFPMYLAAINFI
jgi:hypothetical protein